MIRRIQLSETFRRYFFNTGWLMAERICRLMLAFFVSAYVARYLGPSNFGLINYVTSLVALFIPLMSLGMDNVLVKEFVRGEFSKRELLFTSLTMKLISSLLSLTSIIVISWFWFTPADMTFLLVMIMSISSIFKAFNGIEFSLQAEVRGKVIAGIQFASFFTSSLMKLAAIFTEAPLTFFMFAYGFEFISLGIVDIAMTLQEKANAFTGSWNGRLAKLLCKESLPLIFAHIVIMVNMKIDQILMKDLLGTELLGNYSIAVKLSEITYFVPMALQTSLYPLMAKYYSENRPLYEHYLKVIMNLLFWAFIFLGLTMNFIGKDLIHLVFGERYDVAHQALVIHIFSGVFVSFNVFLSQRYIFEVKNQKTFWSNFGAMVTNITLNLLLVPRLGIQGAAISVLISTMMMILTVTLFMDREVGKICLRSLFYFRWFKR